MMKLFKKRKKPEQTVTVLEAIEIQENEKKKPKHAVVEYCDHIITAAKDLEETKQEYKEVTNYLTDIQIIEELPLTELHKIQETAQSLQKLNETRNSYGKKARTISDAQFAQMEQVEDEIPDAISRLKANESYQSVVKRDMQYLEGEKSEWHFYQEALEKECSILKRIMYGLAGIFVISVVVVVILSQIIRMDLPAILFVIILIAGGAGGGMFWRLQNNEREIKKAQVSINRAITLLNKVKLKYVNITNAVDYACEKYHVKNSYEMNYIWEQYIEAVTEQEKYQRTNEELEYFNSKLIRDLHAYHLYDAKVWIHQPQALLNKKEMTQVQQELQVRRQKLKSRIEYQISNIQTSKREIENLIKGSGLYEKEIKDILNSLDRICGIS